MNKIKVLKFKWRQYKMGLMIKKLEKMEKELKNRK